jgi:hypothetical protein
MISASVASAIVCRVCCSGHVASTAHLVTDLNLIISLDAVEADDTVSSV